MVASKSDNTTEQSDVFKQLENFGKFQSIQYLLIGLPVVMIAMMNVNFIFVAEEVKFRCRVPLCEDDNSSMATPEWWPKGTDTECYRPVVDPVEYARNNQICSNTTFTEQLEKCTDWIYEHYNSVVAKLNLGCQSWKGTVIGSAHNAGMVISMLLMGWLADKFGRKPAFILCSVGGCIGVAKAFVPSYYAYLVIEFMESLISSGIYTVAIVLLIEVGGETKRVLTGVLFSYAIYVGEVIFAFLAMGLQHWKLIIYAVYSPVIIFFVYSIVLKESTRWQLLRSRTEAAKNTFKVMIKINKLDLTHKEITEISEDELKTKLNVETQREKETMRDILGSKQIMTRLLVLAYCFFAASFIYYGMVVHSVLLPGDKYTNFVLASLTSFPGDLLALYTFNKFGRRISLQCGYFGCAVFMMAQSFCPESSPWLKVTFFLLGKLGVALCFTGVYTYSVELFPTTVRGFLVGCCSTTARFGGLLAPLTPLLMAEYEALPSILFSVTSFLAVILLVFTPETMTLPLFDTIEQIEAAHKKNIGT